MKHSEDRKVKPRISYIPCTKTELQAIVKDFPKVTEDPYRFVEEFNIVIQTHQPGFSDLHHLVHMLVGEGQAQHWMRTADREKPESSLGLQLGDQPAA